MQMDPIVSCRDCLGEVEPKNGNFELELCYSCNENMLEEEGFKVEKFTFFWQNKSPFSQWHRSTFTENGFTYTCAEQFMMHQKALLMKDTETAERIMKAGYNPREHKALGRQVKPFDAKLWNESCRGIVYVGNKLKFEQNPQLMEALVATKGTTLVEASPYDTIWGIGLLESDPRAHNRSTWRGTNWLGAALTQLRINLIGE